MWSSYQYFDQAQESSQWKWNSKSSLMSNLGKHRGTSTPGNSCGPWPVTNGYGWGDHSRNGSITDFRTGLQCHDCMIYYIYLFWLLKFHQGIRAYIPWVNWPEVKEVKKWQDVFWEYSLDSIHNRYCFNMIPIIHVHYYYYRTSVIYDPYVISSVLFIMMINLDWENILCNILAWGYLKLTIIRSEVLRGLLKMILWLRK